MSTKIFDAYILPAGAYTSARSLLAFSHKIRKTLAPVSERLAYSAMATRVSFIADSFTIGLAHGDADSPLVKMFHEWDHAQSELRAGRRSVSWDFNLEWVLFVAPGGRVVVKLFGEAAMCDAFRHSFPSAKDFHFQTSTDRPPEISRSDWARRRLIWKSLMPAGSYGSCGLTMKLWGDYDGPSVFGADHIHRHLPGLRRRAEAIAAEVAVRDWARIHQIEGGRRFDAPALFAFMRLYASRENAELRRRHADEIAGQLIPRLSMAHLRMPGIDLNPPEIRALQPTAAEQSLACSAL